MPRTRAWTPHRLATSGSSRALRFRSERKVKVPRDVKLNHLRQFLCEFSFLPRFYLADDDTTMAFEMFHAQMTEVYYFSVSEAKF
jgi:hypothetical protein